MKRKTSHSNVSSNDKYMGVKILAAVLCLLIAGLLLIFFNTQDKEGSAVGPSPSGDVQEIRMAVEGFAYVPSSFTVVSGKPVRWVIDATEMSGCTSAILFRDFGISRQLQKGENVIEFTPTKPGTYTFTCGMGMVRGTMTVI